MDGKATAGARATSETEYSHLVGTSSGGHDVATCLYFDQLRADVTVGDLLDLAEHWFAQSGFRPRVLLVRHAGSSRRPRPSMRTLREAASGRKAIEVIQTLQIFPKGRTTIDDTWRPAVYFAVSMSRPTAAFLSINAALDPGAVLAALQQGDAALGAHASYAFSFPARFSPLGYFWGISVQPAGRGVGVWGKRESGRLAHWRDNTSIGIQDGHGRHWYSTSGGYVRDAYPLMLLSAAHIERTAGTVSLRKAIEQGTLGSIVPAGGKFVWSIPREKLVEAQALLDDNEISLSGRRLECSRKSKH